ncbi:MAG: zinc-binding dehydrogenase [bacterium]|nr:zinc-binding dehydrogenase [bacterium]MYB09488.1 zinc-binding dehydrogenase [Acidimicrobiia bacterium]MYG57954.1 zinc-binding dehydrogenase [Acidimicrobiia bacterium]MYJ33073.1 zinc-binding dehydrogenase [Acidimicrobiia bacterium]
MQAARLVDGNLNILDVPVPEPGFEEALIRITSSGVCHSDLHLARGDWVGVSGIEVLGHEAIGVVEALGPGAERYSQVGDRVILGLGGTGGGFWCGACEFCLRGEPRHCPQTQGIMGTFAEQFCVWAKSLVVLPESVGDDQAALACGGLTAYGAVKKLFRNQVPPGRWVAIIGAAGGLGHYAVQIAKALGYKVIGVDIGAARLEFVESLGADMAISADDALEKVTSEIGGVDASIVFSAAMAGFTLGFRLLRPKGLFVAVGLPPTSEGNIELNPFEFFMRDATLIYSAVGTVQDMRELVDMAAAGQVTTHVGRTGPLSELDAIFDELQSGKYVGRAIIDDLAN